MTNPVLFDTLEALQQSDERFGSCAASVIRNHICGVLGCGENELSSFRPINAGLMNTSFVFMLRGQEYIYRIPGVGTERLVNRSHEKQSLTLAKALGLDPTYLYMDACEGWKLSVYLPDTREADYDSPSDREAVIRALQRLHRSGCRADYGLRPWEDALTLEASIDPDRLGAVRLIKPRIRELYERTKGDGILPCFCHGDTYRHNWLFQPDGSVTLIDWEYAGFSDPGVDIGYFIADAMYEPETAEAFISAYLDGRCGEIERFHYLAYTAIIAYYWTLWALVREQDGHDLHETRDRWLAAAERYSSYLLT